MNPGEKDAHGVIYEGPGAYFYGWWRGLQLHCGAERAADCFLVRPSFEKFLTKGISWKVDYPALIQQGPGLESVLLKDENEKRAKKHKKDENETHDE